MKLKGSDSGDRPYGESWKIDDSNDNLDLGDLLEEVAASNLKDSTTNRKPYGDKPYGDKPYGDKPYNDKHYETNSYSSDDNIGKDNRPYSGDSQMDKERPYSDDHSNNDDRPYGDSYNPTYFEESLEKPQKAKGQWKGTAYTRETVTESFENGRHTVRTSSVNFDPAALIPYLLIGFVVFFIASFIIAGQRTVKDKSDYRTEYATVNYFTDGYTSSGDGSDYYVKVEFEYTVDGEKFTATESSRECASQSIKKGDKVPIYVSKEDSSVAYVKSIVDSEDTSNGARTLSYVLLTLLIVDVVICALLKHSSKK